MQLALPGSGGPLGLVNGLGAVTSLAVLAVALAAGCGGDGAEEPASGTPETVFFRASDGVRLEGRLFGDGRVGVVMSHMGRSGDTQADLYPLARRLAAQGYLVLTYNRRGVCPRNGNGCSEGFDELSEGWKDVVGAARLLRRRSAERVALLGASIGAMSSVAAAGRGRVEPAALVEIAGVNNLSGYSFAARDLRRIGGEKLFVSSAGDIYGGADAAREWHAWARPPKRLEILGGNQHGTDMLRPDEPTRTRLTRLVVDFLVGAVPPR